MKKERGLHLLSYLQCLYQQRLISKSDKTEIARQVSISMRTGEYENVIKKLRNVKCLEQSQQHLIAEAIEIAKGGKRYV